jgi:hypothetical protein
VQPRVLPALFARKPLVQQHKHLANVELHVLEIQIFLVIFLHLEQVVELEIELQQAAIPALVVERDDKGAGERGGEVEVNVCAAVFRHVGFLDDAFFFELLVRELVRAEDLLLLLLACLAFGLAAHVV